MGGSQNLAPNSILMVLVELDVHQIVGYHYFDHHQPSRGSLVRLLYAFYESENPFGENAALQPPASVTRACISYSGGLNAEA